MSMEAYEADSVDLKGVVVKLLWAYKSNDLSSLLLVPVVAFLESKYKIAFIFQKFNYLFPHNLFK